MNLLLKRPLSATVAGLVVTLGAAAILPACAQTPAQTLDQTPAQPPVVAPPSPVPPGTPPLKPPHILIPVAPPPDAPVAGQGGQPAKPAQAEAPKTTP
ncbi:MAG: hypothetical protein JOY84_05265 [Curvibacter sp.]|nr:hypothetical protein [Curvibacter sp.]